MLSAIATSAAFCLVLIGLVVAFQLMPRHFAVADNPSDTGVVYWSLVAVATLLPIFFTTFISDLLLVTCNLLFWLGFKRGAHFFNFLTASAAHIQNPFIQVRGHRWVSYFCCFLLVVLLLASQLLSAANGRYTETTQVQNATVSALGAASSLGGCTGLSCLLTSDTYFSMVVKQGNGQNITTDYVYPDASGTVHFPVWPDPSEINAKSNWKFQRQRGVHSVQYNLTCSEDFAPDARFDGAAFLVNDTQRVTVKSSVTVGFGGVLYAYFGMHFPGIEGYTYYGCSFNASKEITDVVWSSSKGALQLVNLTNPLTYNGTWVAEVTAPLTSLALVFSNTLSWWFTAHFEALTSQEDRGAAIYRVAHAFAQTLFLRNAQTTDDTYINQSNVPTDTWWLLTRIQPQAWFLRLLYAGLGMGLLGVFSLGMLNWCRFHFKYTGEWRPVQADGPDGAHVAPEPVVALAERGQGAVDWVPGW